eukprot:285831-Rhodomonas_salina.1
MLFTWHRVGASPCVERCTDSGAQAYAARGCSQLRGGAGGLGGVRVPVVSRQADGCGAQVPVLQHRNQFPPGGHQHVGGV